MTTWHPASRPDCGVSPYPHRLWPPAGQTAGTTAPLGFTSLRANAARPRMRRAGGRQRGGRAGAGAHPGRRRAIVCGRAGLGGSVPEGSRQRRRLQ